ncbi:hypothetical protein [Streptomyces sp. NPDC001978]|uniref:hypothetical protein n=1 Tax=Streptomyces sp. NPDC001978 TaxID=3364627 RepID=UPI003685A867
MGDEAVSGDGEHLAIREQLIAQGRQAIADTWTEANAAVADIAAMIETATGVRLPTGRPSVMDAAPEDITELEQRCAHFLEFVEIYRRWRPRGDRRTLGQLMPELPEDVREAVADHLVRAGLS